MMKKTLKTLTTCLMAVVFLGLGSGISQTVNYLNTPLQSIDGFGACTAWYVKDTHGLSTTKQDQVFNALYSLKTGAGLSMLRMRIPFEFEQTAGTYTPSALANDVWFAQRAKGLGVSTVWATPWSPPAWMKTTNTVLGWSGSADGYLKTANYQDFANFLAQYWKEFKTQSGISLDYISVQNEPDYSPGSYEGCRYSTSNFHDFILKLGPTFASQGVATGIIMPETSTWNDYQTQTSLNDAATRNDISVIALHGYNHNPGAAGVLDGSIYGTNGQLKFAPTSGKPLWETEISRYNVAADPSITDGLVWALNVHDALTKANANAWHAWWAIDFHAPGDLKCEGLITCDPNTKALTFCKRLYVVGNYARFVRPGFTRMNLSSSNPVTGVYVTAFKQPVTGEVVLVAINNGTAAQNVSFTGLPIKTATPYRTSATENLVELDSLDIADGNLSASLPAKSVTTFDGFYDNGPADGTYSIQNSNSNLVLDISGASTASNAQAVQTADNSTSNQQWKIAQQTDGTYTIVNVKSGLALGVQSSSSLVNATIVQAAVDGSDNQKWLIYKTPFGTWGFFNLNSRLKLGVLGNSTVGNAAAAQSPESGNSSQMWALTPVVSHSNLILNGDFESGTTDAPWVHWNQYASLSSTGGNLQPHALVIRGNAGGAGQFVAVQPNTTYNFSGWGRVDANIWGGLGYSFRDASGNRLGATVYLDGFSSSYSIRQGTFTTPANAASVIIQVWGSWGATGASYFDDISLIQN